MFLGPDRFSDRYFHLFEGWIQSVGLKLVLEEVPADFNRVEFWSGCGKPFHLNGFSVGFQPTFDFHVPMGCGPIEEYQHIAELSLQYLDVSQKVSSIHLWVLSEELLTFQRNCSEDAGSPMRAGCEDEGSAASESPDVTDDRVVEEDGFILA